MALSYLKLSNPFYSDILINLDNINKQFLSLNDVDTMVEYNEFPPYWSKKKIMKTLKKKIH